MNDAAPRCSMSTRFTLNDAHVLSCHSDEAALMQTPFNARISCCINLSFNYNGDKKVFSGRERKKNFDVREYMYFKIALSQERTLVRNNSFHTLGALNELWRLHG